MKPAEVKRLRVAQLREKLEARGLATDGTKVGAWRGWRRPSPHACGSLQ